MKLEVGKKYITRNGEYYAEITHNDGSGYMPFIGILYPIETACHFIIQKIVGAKMEGICHPGNIILTLLKNITHLFNLPIQPKRKSLKSHVLDAEKFCILIINNFLWKIHNMAHPFRLCKTMSFAPCKAKSYIRRNRTWNTPKNTKCTLSDAGR